jgi:hypothetical protein
MAFMLPMIGETIVSGLEAGVAGGLIQEVAHQFAPPIKNIVADETGKIIGNVAKNNPDGIVNKTLDKATFYKSIPKHHKKRIKRRIG